MSDIRAEIDDEITSLIATYLEGLHNPKDDSLYNELRAKRDTEYLKDAIQALLEKKIREARLERGIYELERLHHIPQMFGDWEKVVDERIALLESEQLKDSKGSDNV